jgi:uncharacterized membrane protein
MQDFLFFLGRFHVLALHLPIGMAILAVALDWLARAPKRATLAAALPYVWGAAAISAVLTAVLGYMHFAEGGFSGPAASAHRLYGTIVAIVCVAVWLLSAKRPELHRKLNVVTGLALLALVTITGHYGGNLTHGSEYLVEYAPQPLRALAGLPERRPQITELAAADPWHDIIQPMLNARCASCHNADKRSAELSIVDYASLMAGGETGRVISPGNVEVSELYHRITLPQDDEAFMPAEGKTPLTAAQAAILGWWIGAGAPVDTPLAAIQTPADVEALLRVEVGLDPAEPVDAGNTLATDPVLVDALFAAGLLARQVSQSDPRLVVSVHSVGTALDAAQLAALRSAAASIVSLDLQSTGLDDAAVAGFDAFAALTELRLSNNALTDAGVRSFGSLPKLEVLNLYGNEAVSDAALDTIAAMAGLRTAYLWNTGVTPDGVARLRETRPDIEIRVGADFQ